MTPQIQGFWTFLFFLNKKLVFRVKLPTKALPYGISKDMSIVNSDFLDPIYGISRQPIFILVLDERKRNCF